MRLPLLGRGAERQRNASKGIELARVALSDIDCTVNGWCKCKDEGGTRTVSGDSSGATAVECCVDAKDNMRDECDATCANIGGRDKYQPCTCSADPDLYQC